MDKGVIHSVFEEVVKKQPLKMAIETQTDGIKYGDLNVYANRIAHLLKSVGCRPGTIVNVVVPASIQSVAAMLGVFKSGGIFLPIDLSFPLKRLNQIFKETFDGIVIVSEDTYAAVNNLAHELNIEIGQLVVLKTGSELGLYSRVGGEVRDVPLHETMEWQVDPVLEVNGSSSNYIFYTSGSTGEGKAIVGAHAGLSHFVHWEIKEFSIDGTFRVSQLAQITFDASLRDIFVALISGGTLYIPSVDIKSNPARLLEWIADSQLTIVHCVPSLFRVLTKELQSGSSLDAGINRRYDLSHLQYILMAGELLYAKDIINWRKAAGDKVRLVNFYGPTETTLIKTFYRIDGTYENPAHIIPVGVPISNTSIAIIKDGVICKEGQIGEIHIKTPFATKGYYKNEALTNAYFIQNPLLKDRKDIVYKTGDLGRYLPDGNIEVLGRLDSQVKVNGVRVELSEVEQAMLENEKVTGTVIKVHQTDDNLVSLIAYYTGQHMEADEIRGRLAKVLGPQLIPSYFIHLDEFPLTINGKIDKKALPLPEDIVLGGANFEAPVGDLENKLAVLWKEVLGLTKIGRDTSFFSVGGHSLRAIQLISRIHKEIGVSLKIADIFAQRTIRELAIYLAKMGSSEYIQIDPIPVQSAYALSSGQRRLWVLSQFEEASIAYHMSGVYVFEGSLDEVALAYAFDASIARHESLRTVFKEDVYGEVRQFILPADESGFSLSYRDLRQEEEHERHAREIITEDCIKPFDLAAGPLLRASLSRLKDDEWVFAYTMHHIISDGWSMGVLIKELLQFYAERSMGGTDRLLKPLRIQYKDYAAWQQEQLTGDIFREHKKFWTDQFAGELPVLGLSGDKPRPAVKTYRGGTIGRTIHAGLRNGISSIVEERGSTLFMGLLAAVNALLYRYTGQEDIVIGSPIAGREFAGLEDQIGFYLNTLALRTRFNGKDNFFELLENVKGVTLDAYEHRVYPFDELVDELRLQRDMSRSALFDVMVVMQNATSHTAGWKSPEGVKVSGYGGVAEVVSKFDLTFNFGEVGEAIQLGIEYNSDIFNEDTICRLADHFEQLLLAIIDRPSVPILELDFLGDHEKQVLYAFNNTEADYLREATIHGLFEQQAERTPDRIALIFQDLTFTYKELNERANRLAGYLRKHYGVKADDLIAVKMERSEEMVIAILGILKAGGAYVPIDPEYPAERVEYMLADSNCKAVIDDGELARFRTEEDSYGPQNLLSINQSTDLVYVIYTSGSTGRPKGCMLEHRGIVNRITWMWQQFGFNEEDVILQKTAFTFDVSVWELFMPLCFGAKMVLCEREDAGSPERILALIEAQQITCLHFVPSMLTAFIASLFEEEGLEKSLGSLRRVITSGEALLLETTKDWYGKLAIPIHNLYGPTEASVDVTCYSTSAQDSQVPIGRPIWNTQLYIIEGGGQLTPVGVTGELCIGGDGLARGYLNKRELTEEKFVANPFSPGTLMYKTGDLARWLPDGNIEFIGRADDQVKVRGYRIELGEIENVLQKHPDIDSAVVIARSVVVDGQATRTEEKQLIAYIVSKRILDVQDVRDHLSRLLPGYMVPGYFVQLDKLPLTSSGKVDRKRLPQPEGASMAGGTAYVAPGNRIEEKLIRIWQQILDREQIGINDNFFDLGGHSLKATRLASQVHKTFDVKLPLREFFSKAVLKEQAWLIAQARKDSFVAIAPAEKQSSYPLSSSQRRLWVLGQFEEGNIAYNMTGAYVFEGVVDAEALARSFDALITRHEILRTIFKEDEKGEIRQFIQSSEEIGFRMTFQDLRTEKEKTGLVGKLVRRESLLAFDLSSGPLLRAGLYQVRDQEWIFTYAMHHIISDGWSMRIMINELLLLYNAEVKGIPAPLAPLRIQYKDYAVWQLEQLSGQHFQEHKKYWSGQFSAGIPILDISKRPRPQIFSYKGDALQFTIDAHKTGNLVRITNTYNGTLFTTLLFFVKLLLYKYSNKNRIMTGTSLAGRDHYDLENQIGLYINNLPLIADIRDDWELKQFYYEVKNTVLNALNHQAYPLDVLVNDIQYKMDASRSGLFSVWVEFYNEATGDAPVSPEGFSVIPYEGKRTTSYFDLTFDFQQIKDEVSATITYNKDLFDHAEIALMKERFIQLLINVSDDFDESRRIGEIDLVIREEVMRTAGSYLKFDLEERF